MPDLMIPLTIAGLFVGAYSSLVVWTIVKDSKA